MKKELLGLINMVRKRDFKGYTGIAVKNSIYQIAKTTVAKIGSLLFTIILARILMPELFGLYSLVLATIIMISSFFNIGIETTMVRFISKSLGEGKKSKAKGHFTYLFKLKIVLIIFSASLLFLLSKFLANNYYNKPIFLALLAGSFYLLCIGLIGFFTNLFQSFNDFKPLFFQEIFFQVLKFVIVPLITLYAIKNFASQELILFTIIFSLSLVYLASLIFISIFAFKKMNFLHIKQKKLTKKEKSKTNKFILIVFSTSLSGFFFAYIDMIMLGHFVLAEFIGFYQAAKAILSSLIPLITFSAVFFPIFSRIKGEQLERGFRKSIKATFILSSIFFLGTLIFAPLAIGIVYGKDYALASNLLRMFSFLILVTPLIALYTSYFVAKGKPGVVTKFLIPSTILNIILNYFLISWLINYSNFLAVVGATIATIISKYTFFALLVLKRRKDLSPKSDNVKTN